MSVQGPQGPAQTTPVIHQFRPRNSAPAPAAAGTAESADSSGITDAARRLSQAQPVVEDAPEVRTNIVRALKAAIANGTYQADDREVARRLLERGL